MALIGEMKYLTIGGKTYQIPVPESGSSVEFTPNLTSGTKVGDLTIDSSTVSLYAPTNTDTKLQIAAVTSGTTYYPVVAANSTTAATRQYDATGLAYAGTNGTTSAVGTAKITLGNSTASGTANNKKGQITLYGSTAYATTIDPGSPTAARTITLPDKTGTVALTSDIPTMPTNISSFTNDVGYITSYTDEKVKTTSFSTGNLYLTGQTDNAASSGRTLSYSSGFRLNKSNSNNYKLYIGSGAAGDISQILLGKGTNFTTLTPSATTGITLTLPDTAGTIALTSDIPTVPTNISSFTNDAGYITSADVPEGASAYTGTISAVGTAASSGTNNGFARGDHVHNLTKSVVDSALGTSSATTKFYREDGTWATPAYTTNTDAKLQVAEVTSGTIYYPLVGTGTTAATRQYDTTGLTYRGINGTTSAVGYSTLTLGNNKASTTANNKQGQLIIYGSTAYAHTIQGAPTANRTLTLPNATGTIALTSDIPSVPDVSGKIDTAGTGLSKSGTTLNHSNSVTAQATQAVYPIKIDAQGHISAYGSAVTIPSVTLNGSSSTSPSFYAPTGAGTSGQYLKSSGTGAPTWTNFPTIPSITLNGSSSTSPSFYAPTSAGTSGYYLKSSGSGAPTWTAFPTIPTVPNAGNTATAITHQNSSGGSATTWSKSDHVHNITSTTITSALGYTPYNSTNPNGYTSNTGTVTGVKVNGTTINPTSGVVDIGTVATSDIKVNQVQSTTATDNYSILFTETPQVLDVDDTNTAVAETRKSIDLTFIPRSGSDSTTTKSGQLIVNQNGPTIGYQQFYNASDNTIVSGNGFAVGTVNSSQNEIVATANHGVIRARHWNAAKNTDGSVNTSTNYIATESLFGTNGNISTTSYTMENSTVSKNYQTLLSPGSNWFCLHDSLYGVRMSQNGLHPYVEIFDGRSTSTGNTTYRLDANGLKKLNNYGSSYKVQTNGTSSSLAAATWTNKGSFTLAAGTWLINVTGIWGYSSNTGIRCVRLTTTNSTSNPAAVTDGAAATMSQHATYENKCGFSVILAPTASTTYYIMMYSATSNTAFASYSYFRLL